MGKYEEDITIFTEEPEKELWRRLLQYSYKANIKRYYEENHINYLYAATDENGCLDTLSNSIAGALLQANEYYKASRSVSLQVEPLLLYYGTSNLLYALYVLTTGRLPNIDNHGMRIKVRDHQGYIADTGIIFNNPQNGGVHIFAKCLGIQMDLCKLKNWTLSEFFDSIAEIKDDFEQCYQGRKSKVIQLYEVNTPDGSIEKIYIDDNIHELINQIEGFSKAYLKKPQKIDMHKEHPYYVLHHKMNGDDIHQISYSGQPYLQVAHSVNSQLVTVPKELNMYISLFVLGNICRYHPYIWNPFVTQDSTGEKLLIEKVLYYSRRILPNIVLSRIIKKQVYFVSDKYTPENRIHLVGEHEVKELINQEVQKQIRNSITESIMYERKYK